MLSVSKCFPPSLPSFRVCSFLTFIEIGTRICEMALTAGERAIYMQISALCHCHAMAMPCPCNEPLPCASGKAKKEERYLKRRREAARRHCLQRSKLPERMGSEDATAAGQAKLRLAKGEALRAFMCCSVKIL